jgi:hypothetical protein
LQYKDRLQSKLSKQSKRLRASGLFDEEHYLTQTGPLPPGTDAAEHFLTVGEKLDLNPSAQFDTHYCRIRLRKGNRHDSPMLDFLSLPGENRPRTQSLADEFTWPLEVQNKRRNLVLLVEDLADHAETRFALSLMHGLSVDWHVYLFVMSGSLLTDPFTENPHINIIQHNPSLAVGPSSIDYLEVNCLSRAISYHCQPDCVLALGANTWPLLPYLQSQLTTVLSIIHTQMREPVSLLNLRLFLSTTRFIIATEDAATAIAQRSDANRLANVQLTPAVIPEQHSLLSEDGIALMVQAVTAAADLADGDLRPFRNDAATIAESGLFHSDFYRRSNTLQKDVEIVNNYIWSEARTLGFRQRRPMPGFNSHDYKASNHQLMGVKENAFAHFLRQRMPEGNWHTPLIVQQKLPDALPNLKVALHGHFYYPDLLEQFFQALAANRTKPDLFLNVPEQRHIVPALQLAKKFQLQVIVRVFPNKGRDLGSFFTGFRRELFSNNYDVVGHVHSKKTQHILSDMGDNWRNFLWEHLLGSDASGPMLDQTIAAFANNPKLGLVFPADPHLLDWATNLPVAEGLASRLNLKGPFPELFDFPIGTMFWCRPDAFARLTNLNFTWDDYPLEPIAEDGTMLHALERLLPFVVKADGYTLMNTHVPNVNWIFG